jgi:hypothetical protein
LRYLVLIHGHKKHSNKQGKRPTPCESAFLFTESLQCAGHGGKPTGQGEHRADNRVSIGHGMPCPSHTGAPPGFPGGAWLVESLEFFNLA